MDRQQVQRAQQGTAQQHGQQQLLVRLQRARDQEPLAPGAAARRQSDDAQRGDEEGGHGEGHAAAEAAHLADVRLVGGQQDTAGTEEQRDLAEGVRHHVHGAADDACRGRITSYNVCYTKLLRNIGFSLCCI